jgi:Cys-tRNA(Pro)/Cys-tRNA(Cys) deacylase
MSSKALRAKKTNAVRLLDSLRVDYELLPYEVDPDDLSAVSVSEKVHLPAAQVFKTLVVHGDRFGVCLAVIPSHGTLDLEALALARGEKKMAMVPVAQIEELTGYVRGGVTALGCRRTYAVYADCSLISFERISVSAGTRGLQMYMRSSDYVRVISPTVLALCSSGGNETLNRG